MEELLKTEVIPEKGFIYFCKAVKGKIAVFRAKCGRPKKESVKKVEKEKVRSFESPEIEE